MSRTIFIGGRPVRVDDNASLQDIRSLTNMDRGRFLALQNSNNQGGYEIFDEKRNRLPDRDNDLNFIPLPRYRQGFDYRAQRITEEAKIISSRFPVEFDDDNFDYISVQNFPLNRSWSQPTTSMLIKIPEDYPSTPPVHFFMKQGLTYKGRCPSHYFKDNSFNELEEYGWGKYCIHVTGSWCPTQNILDGDSLITYLELVKTVLDNIEREKV